jgi:hypothetical protein
LYRTTRQLTHPRTETSSLPLVQRTITRVEFFAAFDRCFARLYAYVSRHVNDRQRCEQIVREVLRTNLGLLVHAAADTKALSQLEAASQQLIGLAAESAPSFSSSTFRP